MRLGLGIGVPYGSGVLNPDKLSLDLQFATDKTLTARRGPTPAFTRGNSATYYGPNRIVVNDSATPIIQNTSVVNGRSYWESANGAPGEYDYLILYNGTEWTLRIRYWSTGEDYEESTYSAAAGNEFRPDLADWSDSGATVTTGNTFGILTAIANEPRFDHDPVTLACRGLLIEETRINSLTESNTFNLWGLSGATVATSSILTPDGTTTAFKIVENSATATHSITRAFSVTSGTTYTVSTWLKAAENGFALVGLTGSGVPLTFISVNLSTGAVTTGIGSPVGASSITYPNGWYRVSFSITATSTASPSIDIRLSRDGLWANRSYLGNGVNGMYCYGAQVENGSFVTSYIPTSSTALIRSADVCSITGADFTSMYNSSEGTVVSDGLVASLAGNNRGMWGINNNTSAHGFLTYYDAATPGISSQSRNTTATTLAPNFLNSANTLFKRALAYRAGQGSICTNGSSVTTTSVTISTQTMLTLQIGNMLAGSFHFSGHISRIQYFKKRLPDAKLQSLTTP